jgi:hypothetical protein
MRELLERIPVPDGRPDSWQGIPLPSAFSTIEPHERRAWFVDGGNAAILHAPHFSLQFLRAAAVRYPDKAVLRVEAMALVTRGTAADGAAWHVTFLGGRDALTARVETLEEAIDAARQSLERELAEKARASGEGIVVRDGDASTDGILALQKSSTVLTANGFPLSAVLREPGTWSAALGDRHAVRLHPRSRHVLLLHGLASVPATEVARTIGILAWHARDTLFPGYPAGLVLADKLARVSRDEALALRVRARHELRELRGDVDAAQAAIDSHETLDSL